MAYRINSPSVIHETIDDEVVIINLDKGHYYSLNGSGARIWTGLLSGAEPAEVAASFEGDTAVAETGVLELTTELEQEGLIVPVDGAGATGKLEGAVAMPFEPAKLQRYSDMEELLLLDPIHEVDEQGWPHPNPAA